MTEVINTEEKVIKRGKNKIQKPLTLSHIYLYYIKDLEKDSKYYVNYRTFRDICEEYNKMISTLMVEEGYFFKVPYRLGTLRIKKNKVKVSYNNLKPDFGLYNKSGGKYKNKHLNEHSGYYYVKYHWVKVDAIIINKVTYSFIPTRYNKRYLAATVKKGGMLQMNKYFE